MKKNLWLVLGLLGCLVVVAVGYVWTTDLIGSVFSFRSPLKDTPPTPGPALGHPLSRRVVIVLIDALRTDTAGNSKVMPFLNQLRSASASATIHSHAPSYSEPGYTTILTGAWPDINDGPPVNLEYGEIHTFTQDDVFTNAHQLGLKTAISGYYWFQKLVPTGSVDAGFFTSGEDAAADEQVMEAALPLLTGNYQLILIHLDQVDYAGHHLGGPIAPAWDEAAHQTDIYLQQIAAHLNPQNDTLIVLSDHGQINRGGHGGPEPITLVEPFVMAGAGVKPGKYPDMEQVDVAPTITALLGTSLPASSEGQVLTKMLNLSSNDASRIEAAEAVQKDKLLQTYEKVIQSQAASQPDPSRLSSYSISMYAARDARLSRERVGRNVAALVLALLPAGLLFLRGDKKALWLLAGALAYLLLFVFRYSLLDGRTYSLSSVSGQADLISYTGITAAIALLIVWPVCLWRMKAFQGGPRLAANTSLGLVYMILYFLALPVLVSFAVNGVVVTWTLPEFYSMFLATLAMIQWIFVAALGLLLTGLAALVGRLVPHPVHKTRKHRR